MEAIELKFFRFRILIKPKDILNKAIRDELPIDVVIKNIIATELHEFRKTIDCEIHPSSEISLQYLATNCSSDTFTYHNYCLNNIILTINF